MTGKRRQAQRPTERDLDLLEIAAENAAEACQSGASLMGRGLDPIAAEYMQAALSVRWIRQQMAAKEWS